MVGANLFARNSSVRRGSPPPRSGRRTLAGASPWGAVLVGVLAAAAIIGDGLGLRVYPPVITLLIGSTAWMTGWLLFIAGDKTPLARDRGRWPLAAVGLWSWSLGHLFRGEHLPGTFDSLARELSLAAMIGGYLSIGVAAIWLSLKPPPDDHCPRRQALDVAATVMASFGLAWLGMTTLSFDAGRAALVAGITIGIAALVGRAINVGAIDGLRSPGRDRGDIVLLIGVLLFSFSALVLADGLWAADSGDDADSPLGWSRLAYPAGYLGIAFAAALRPVTGVAFGRRGGTRSQESGVKPMVISRWILPIGPVAALALVAIGAILVNPTAQESRVLFLLTLTAVGLVLVRQSLTLADHRRGTEELRQRHSELETLAITDPITKLPNHRAVMERLTEEIERAGRYDQPVSLCFIDVDFFKAVNDSHGHQAGDRIIHQIGLLVRQVARAVDIVGRYGGEEFVVVMPGTPASNAALAAERLRAAVARHAFPIDAEVAIRLSISVGVAGLPEHAADREGLIDRADQALYGAKRSGRNQVQVFDPTSTRSASGPADFTAARNLAVMAEERDGFAVNHAVQVGLFATALAELIGLSSSEVERVKRAALLLDIGKVAVPESILLQAEPLSMRELDVLKRHPVVGATLVSQIPGLESLATIIRHHHERWDGGGYPDGLMEEEIPVGARIVAIADAFTSMTKARAFRPALTADDAINELRRCGGTQFDPMVVEPMISLIVGNGTAPTFGDGGSEGEGVALAAAAPLFDAPPERAAPSWPLMLVTS